MTILFLGGTGIISTACTHLAIARGHEVTLLNRSKREPIAGTRQIVADIGDSKLSSTLQNEHWDAVVDFIAFDAASVEQRIELFRGKTQQYVFISSASAYQKPLSHFLITESTPLANPFWEYSRNKIAAEDRLLRAYRDDGFPITIIRPSLTYGDLVIPLAINSWTQSFTAITHNSDFAKGLVGLLGHPAAIGHAFHITSDEALTWNQLYELTAEAAGVTSPRFVHIASDFVTACYPEMTGTLLGDKSHSAVFDNSKIKRFVPDFVATTRFRDGIAKTIRAFDANPKLQSIDGDADRKWDRLIEAYERGLDAARRELQA
jgi:nucleoside-diphosphate-sugar epimerase